MVNHFVFIRVLFIRQRLLVFGNSALYVVSIMSTSFNATMSLPGCEIGRCTEPRLRPCLDKGKTTNKYTGRSVGSVTCLFRKL